MGKGPFGCVGKRPQAQKDLCSEGVLGDCAQAEDIVPEAIGSAAVTGKRAKSFGPRQRELTRA